MKSKPTDNKTLVTIDVNHDGTVTIADAIGNINKDSGINANDALAIVQKVVNGVDF